MPTTKPIPELVPFLVGGPPAEEVGYVVIIDPPTAIADRAELNLNSGLIALEQRGIDWGEAAVKAYMAEQRFGETAVGYRVPNRVVTLPLGVGMAQFTAVGTPEAVAEEESARRQLLEKVALLQREGGVLLRRRAGGERMYVDIVNAALSLPDRWGERGGIEPEGSLKLECLPDFYGEEIALDAMTGSGNVVGVLQRGGSPAVIPGDYPARGRIVLTEESGNKQRSFLWGLRSRNYSESALAALAYNASSLTPINGAHVVSAAWAYGGKAVEVQAITKAWHPFLTTDLAGEPLTHVGSYRVFARVNGKVGMQFQLLWSLDDASTPVQNTAAELTVAEPQLLDLGEIRVPKIPVGQNWWRGVLAVFSPVYEPAWVDRILFVPADEATGRANATGISSTASLSSSHLSPTAGTSEPPGIEWKASSGKPLTERANLRLPPIAPGKTNSSQNLNLTKFGFAIPGGSEITAIGVTCFVFLYEPPGGQVSLELGLMQAGADAGSDATISINQGSRSLQLGGPGGAGGVPPLWGTSWTSADINNEGFGVQVHVTAGEEATLSIEAVQVQIWYSFSPLGVPTDAVLYANKHSQVRTEGTFREDTSGSYVAVSQALGDLARIPPSGLEHRKVELLVKPSRGQIGIEPDAGIDKIGAQVFVRPCYIGRI